MTAAGTSPLMCSPNGAGVLLLGTASSLLQLQSQSRRQCTPQVGALFVQPLFDLVAATVAQLLGTVAARPGWLCCPVLSLSVYNMLLPAAGRSKQSAVLLVTMLREHC